MLTPWLSAYCVFGCCIPPPGAAGWITGYRPGMSTLAPEPRDPSQAFWDPEIQTMDRERLRALQDERLRSMIRAVFETPVPLFKRKLEDAGISGPDDIKGVDDINAIPLMVKQDLRDSEAA